MVLSKLSSTAAAPPSSAVILQDAWLALGPPTSAHLSPLTSLPAPVPMLIPELIAWLKFRITFFPSPFPDKNGMC